MINTIIGQVARGESFLPRPQITDDIWRKLGAGSNLLLVAPRRVGKSSILYNLMDEPKENFIVIYYTSESVNNENEFYKKLYTHITDKLSGVLKYKSKIQVFSKSLFSRIESISTKGVELGESKISYQLEIQKLIKEIALENEKLIVLIDEFAQTVENIMRDESDTNAIHFLASKREIRQLPESQGKLQFIYAGSIGLENIARKINGINFIADLVPINITPLTKNEANELVKMIFLNTDITLEDDSFTYLLKRIEWLMPFYFQIILDESFRILCETKKKIINNAIIDSAIKNSLGYRIYFENWFTRLRKAYQGNEFSFIKVLLNFISEKIKIDTAVIVDLAVKYKIENNYNDLINALKHDGYINNNDDAKTYRFNSPLLREWWYNNVAN